MLLLGLGACASRSEEAGDTRIATDTLIERRQVEDTLLVFSVGGGDLERNVSPNLVKALQFAKTVGVVILGIVGRDGGYTAQVADACAIVPTVNAVHTTPHAEAFQAVVWHLLVSHPIVKQAETKWESVR